MIIDDIHGVSIAVVSKKTIDKATNVRYNDGIEATNVRYKSKEQVCPKELC